MNPAQRAEYSAIVDRPPLRLPGGARLVVWPILNVEHWEIARPMPRQVLPAPAGQAPLPDVPNWAWHEYGMRVGFWRLKAALDARGISCTVSINGSVCTAYPRVAGACRDAGWEFMGHGFVQRPTHQELDQRAMIQHTVEAIAQYTGKPPRGWLGPGLTETLDTPDLLAEAGIQYVGDWVLDDEPVPLRVRCGRLISLPYSVELNDIPMMLVQHHPAQEFVTRCMDSFERLYAESAQRAKIMAIAFHPYVHGTPFRIKYFETVLDRLQAQPGVVFWTGEQILDWYLREQPVLE